MSEDDITILPSVRAMAGPSGRLYYYQGNFYYPFTLHGSEVGRVRKAIRQWRKENTERVARDRADPSYRTIVQLFDEGVTQHEHT